MPDKETRFRYYLLYDFLAYLGVGAYYICMTKQLELVQFPKVNHIRIMVNEISYRNAHLHKEFELLLVIKGCGEITISGVTTPCKAGDIFFIASHDIHLISAKKLEDGTLDEKNNPVFLIIQVSNHFLLNYFPQIRTTIFKSCRINDILPGDRAKIGTRLLSDSALSYFKQDNYYQLTLVSEISQIMAYIYKYIDHEIVSEIEREKIKKKSNRLERIISYIDLNFSNHIRLEDIANEEDLSVTHFSHLFSSYFGVTFQEYVNLRRMESAIRLMENTEKSLLEISYESGFSDPKYMTKMFLKKFGCTPKQYRREHISVDGNKVPKTYSNQERENIYSISESIKVLEAFNSDNNINLK